MFESKIVETTTLGELDLALVHALQIRPRATWAELAEPLGTTATTLARRWERLSQSGMAWVSAAPGPVFDRSRYLSFVMINTSPARRTEVVKELAKFPEVATIEVATGAHDLNIDVLTKDLEELDRILTEKIYPLDGVTSVATLLTTSLYQESSAWRLRSLDQEQLGTLNTSSPEVARNAEAIELDELDRSLLDLLVRDGRLSWVELAAQTETSTATCRRRVNRMVSSGMVSFRCEIAHSIAGWPIQASLLARVPAADLDRVCRMFAALSECRFVAAVTGPANVYATFWVNDLRSFQRLEAQVSQVLPDLTVLDRMVALSTPKRMGHLCDIEGRRTGIIPITPW